MNLLFLCKRRPMDKDLITTPYGRFYYIPEILSEYGHQCTVLLLNYKQEQELDITKDNIRWLSVNLGTLPGIKFYRTASAIIKNSNIDWVIGFSDTYFGILAQHLAQKYSIRSLIDAYDNYESYIHWLKPLHWLWRRALGKATAISAAGPGLASLMSQYRHDQNTYVVPMAADPAFKKSPQKQQLHEQFNLPENRTFIAYCGSMYHNRGIETLFNALKIVEKNMPDVEVILTGRKQKNITIPEFCNWLGYLPDENMPDLLNNVDLLIVMGKPGAFGDFSYPVKLYEAIQCQTPVIAIDTPATRWILQNNNDLLVKPDDPVELASSIQRMIHDKTTLDTDCSWESSTSIFQDILTGK